MRYTPAFPKAAIPEVQGLLEPPRVMRWVWLGRVMLACAILVAAVFVWKKAEPNDTLIATLAFAIAVLVTVASVIWSEYQRRHSGNGFYALQCAVDLALVTAVVHLTGGWSSQFAALYILVIASAALLLPFRGGLFTAAGACSLYLLDALWLRPGQPQAGMFVQLIVFVIVAAGAGFVASRVRQAGVGRDALAAELVKVQLEAADILRTIRAGILTIDSSGRLLYANPAAAELLGINLRAYVGRPVLPTLRRTSPSLVELLEHTARDGIRTSRAEGVIFRDGEQVAIGVTTTIADRSDRGPGATAIFQDISDSKRLQALHVRAERLQAVAELSASLAHEIRNPLASIRSATEQLARRRGMERPGADDDDERVLHGLVVREADRLSRLLGDFLDFARARVTRIAAIDLGALATAATTLAASHPDRGTRVTVDTQVDSDLPPFEGDEDLLHRAIFNLVLNALQAVGETGSVRVRVHEQQVSGHSATGPLATVGHALVVTVTDDGPGIPEALREHLFEPFVTGKTGGTGLGLPVVHRAVEAHQGVVLVDSLPLGTRFTVLLPLHEMHDVPPPRIPIDHADPLGVPPSATAESRLIGAAS